MVIQFVDSSKHVCVWVSFPWNGKPILFKFTKKGMSKKFQSTIKSVSLLPNCGYLFEQLLYNEMPFLKMI